jgi:hypothetical protein
LFKLLPKYQNKEENMIYFFLKEIQKIEDEIAKMDEKSEELFPENTTSIRTVANLSTAPNEGTAGSPILLLDPTITNTKGRPRHITIREAIKANKFYKCSHYEDTLFFCERLWRYTYFEELPLTSIWSLTSQNLKSLEDQRKFSHVSLKQKLNIFLFLCIDDQRCQHYPSDACPCQSACKQTKEG